MKTYKIGDVICFRNVAGKTGKGQIVERYSGDFRDAYLVKLLGELEGTGHTGSESSLFGPYATNDYWYIKMNNPSIKKQFDTDTDESKEKIVIKRSGNKLTATLKQKGLTKRVKITTIAGKIDTLRDAKTALNELYGGADKETEKLYNAKLVCVKDGGDFTKGKIYEVKDGFLYGDMFKVGSDFHEKVPFKDLEELNHIMIADFIELKEE